MPDTPNNVGESDRVHHSTMSVEWAAFDQLPLSVRRGISQAPYEYSAEQIRDDYKRMKADPWLGLSDYEYVNMMESNFRADVQRDAPAEVHRYGNYKFTTTVPQKPKCGGADFRGIRKQRYGR